MLRINLLPAYIAERKRTRTSLILASLLWIAVLGAGLGYHFGLLTPQVEQKETDANTKTDEATKVTAIQTEATSILAQVAPIKDKVDFVEAIRYANRVRQKIYRNAARYTYRTVEYNQMAVDGSTLSVAGFVKNTDDLGRFYLTMFGNPDVTAVSIQGIPAYAGPPPPLDPNSEGPSPATVGWFPVQLTANLVKPVVSPSLPASVNGGAAGGAGGGFGGAPSFGGGSGGPPPGYGGGARGPRGGSRQSD